MRSTTPRARRRSSRPARAMSTTGTAISGATRAAHQRRISRSSSHRSGSRFAPISLRGRIPAADFRPLDLVDESHRTCVRRFERQADGEDPPACLVRSIPGDPPVRYPRRRNTMFARVLLLVSIVVVVNRPVTGQSLTGGLVGTVRDAQGQVVQGAVIRLTSHGSAGAQTQTTTATGELRFPALSPGEYALDVEAAGFTPFHEEGIHLATGATLERLVVLHVAGVRESIVVGGAGSRIEARNSGVETRFEREDLQSIPTRRFSMFDFIKVAPGVSPTSPGSP